jgi:hypothetical protein
MTDWTNNKWQIDERRRNERTQNDKSWDDWNWVFHEGWWYPKLGRWEIAKKHERLMNLDEYGTDDLLQLLEDGDIKVHTCDACGWEAKSKDALHNHIGNRSCRNRKARQEADENGTPFVLESQKKVTCEHCSKEFANKYSLDRHCKTQHVGRIKVV